MHTTTLPLALFCVLTVVPLCRLDSVCIGQAHASNGGVRAQQSADWSPSRNWETEVMGVKVRGTAQRRNNEIKGVLHIYPPMSDKLTYHWFGKIEGDRIWASHSDGHSFSGSITPDRTMEGIVTTRYGHRIPIKAPLP